MRLLSSTQVDDPQAELIIERDPGEECLATFWRQATPGTTYYRCYLPAKYLPGQCLQMLDTDVIDSEDEKRIFEMPRSRGIQVWQFLGDDARTRLALHMQQEHGVKTVLEVDDNYIVGAPTYNGKTAGSWRKTHAEAVASGTQYSYEVHRAIVEDFDVVICATENLAETYAEYNENVVVCPNQIEPSDWEDQDEKDPNVLRFVYSGSQSHWYDIPIITKAMRWLERQPGVEVYYQGIQPRGGQIGKKVPWVEGLAGYRKSLGRFDVGLAPIKPGKWANGKSDLKALEFAMSSVMPVLGQSIPYEDWIDRFPEYTVPFDEKAWLDKVKWIVKNRDMVKDVAAQWKDIVLAERTIEGNIGLWREALS